MKLRVKRLLALILAAAMSSGMPYSTAWAIELPEGSHASEAAEPEAEEESASSEESTEAEEEPVLDALEAGGEEAPAEEAGEEAPAEELPKAGADEEEEDGSLLEEILGLDTRDVEAEAASEAEASGIEVYSAESSMDYYMAVSELVKGAGAMITSSEEGSFEDARLLVKGEDDLDFSEYEGARRVVTDSEGHYTVQFSTSELAEQAAQELSSLDAVEYAEPDEKVALFAEEASTEAMTADQASGAEMGASTATEHKSWGISNIGADEYAAYARTVSTRTIKVAVVDTGVDDSHTYLAGRVLSGRDFVDGDYDPDDGHYHGTHVAGTIVDCTLNLTNIKILPVRVLDSRGSGYTSNVANGVKWAAEQGAEVINMSLGGGHNSAMEEAVTYAANRGALCVVAAGNDNANTSGTCPAHITGAVTVAAVNSSESKASFSNYGAEVDLCAPGVDITSSVPGGSYRSLNGTSMATPHAAAAAALLKLANSSYTPAQLQQAMKDSCRDRGASGRDNYYGEGIIDLRLSLDENERATLTPSVNDVSLGLNSSQTVTWTAGGSLPSTYSMSYSTSGSGFTCSWTGGWYDSTKHDMIISGTAAGSGVITVSLKNSSGSILATAQIDVTVGGVPYPNGGTVEDWHHLESAHDYAHNSDYTWIYTAESERTDSMFLTFDSQTRVENNYDRIYIYSGSATDEDDVLVGSYTDTQLSGQTVTVSGQTVKIRLTSDGSVSYYGFKVTNLEEHNAGYPAGGTVRDWHDLQSAHNYANNSDYTWSYSYPGGAESLNVTFSEETKVENSWDKIYIYDGSDHLVRGNNRDYYTGTELAGQTITVPGQTVKIRLTSDGSVTYYGFRVSDLVPVGNQDADRVTDPTAIASAHPYDNNYDHSWIYTYPEDADSVDVAFDEQTKLENLHDYLYVYDGDGNQVGSYTGTELADQTVTVPGTTVRIRMSTDSNITFWGFAVTGVEPTPAAEPYPESEHNYQINTDETKTWTDPDGADSLDVTFDERTKVENRYDHIYVMDGRDQVVGTYTGTELAGQTVTVPGDTVKVRLTSDGSVNYYGYKVTNIVPTEAAPTNVKITADNASAWSGALVEVPVTITNNPGIAGASLSVDYDESKLTLESIEKGTLFNSGNFTSSQNHMNWSNSSNVTGDGPLFTVTFRVRSDVDAGDTRIRIMNHNDGLVDEDSRPIGVNYEEGKVTLKGGLIGDVTGDGIRAVGDFVLMIRRDLNLCNFTPLQERLSDVDQSGRFGQGDIIRLYQIILGMRTESEAAVRAANAEASEGTVNFQVGNASLKKGGGEITLPVTVSGNCGISGLAASVSAPDGYTLKAIRKGELMKEGDYFQLSGSNILWSSTEDVTSNGILFYIDLTVGAEASTGTVRLKLKDDVANNLANKNGSTISANILNGTVTVQTDLSSASVDAIPDQAYTGNALTPSVVVKDGEKILVKDTDYTVSYENNVNVGTATVRITGKGAYIGTKAASFRIVPKSIGSASIDPIPSQIHTGSALTPAVVVKDGSKVLVKDTDYTVSYENNVNIGTATVRITGKGSYTGTKTMTFSIVATAKAISGAAVDPIPDQTYTGSALRPSIVVKDGSKTLVVNVDYALSYTNNVNVGTATVTITGIGNYTGFITRTFKIVAKKDSGNQIQKGNTQTVQSIKYEVTSADGENGTVKVKQVQDKKIRSVSIKDTVEIGGVQLKVTEIEDGAFKKCTKLQTVTIASGVKKIGKNAFSGCSSLKKVNGSKVEEIGDKAFYNCKKLTKVSFSSAKKVGTSAFAGCTALKTVSLTSSKLTTIGANAFSGDKALTRVTISSKALKSIGSKAFYKCGKLSSITLKTTKLKSVGSKAISGISKNAVIKVPSSKVKAYKKLFGKKAGFKSTMTVKK